ncbi:LPS-assembly protein LptD [Andreprevotia chitinilytica]|uniref:LPS-assembly protein LptD n=1 Tax=Andreprevotia chitinilytica TaxID=396808 RepID=UPI0005524DD1|nr:LPS-assembly protein LptD [Andreprevotia chitinilytica]
MTPNPLPPFRAAPLVLLLVAGFAFAADDDMPMRIDADEVNGQSEVGASARGNVVLERGDMTVESDWSRYDTKTDRLEAGDNVKMTRQGDVLTGHSLDYYIARREGTLTDPNYSIAQGLGRGDAVKLVFEGPDKYELEQGRFTTCPANVDDWYLRANDLSLDYVTNTGIARNAWLEFKGVPLLYSPWMNFPLKEGRQTGLLAPSFAFDNRNGLDITTPLYWNIAPNYDATFYPRYLARRGMMLGGEFRYLQPEYSGQLNAATISDRLEDQGRFALSFKHQQILADRLTMSIDLEKVSDDNYFNDFGDRAAIAAQTNLPRQVQFNYAGDNWSGAALWQKYQTLQSTTNPIDIPYARLPQLSFSATPNWVQGVQTAISGEFTDFTHPSKVNGLRTWVYPTVAMPFVNAYSFVVPKIGVHATDYQLSNADSSGRRNETRVLPTFSVDSGLFFDRDLKWMDQSLTQTLEPRAYYVYIPNKDQSQLPNFDSALTDFSFAQMFRENQFSGNDRINDANQLTLALTSRFYKTETGDELLRATIGQRFYFKQQRVTLNTTDVVSDAKQSDLLLSFGGQLWRNLYADYSLQYNVQNKATGRSSAGVSWQPEAGHVLNLRYAMNRNLGTEQVDFSAQWPLGRNWYGIGRINYSLADSRALETIAGLEYNAGCWGLRLAAQRYITSNGTFNTTYFALLELGGLGGLGSNPIDTLRQSIPGYTDFFASNMR